MADIAATREAITSRSGDARALEPDALKNGMNIVPQRPNFSLVHRDVIPIVADIDGRADASFALSGRPFTDDDVESLRQKRRRR
jgi:hypothetical protein